MKIADGFIQHYYNMQKSFSHPLKQYSSFRNSQNGHSDHSRLAPVSSDYVFGSYNPLFDNPLKLNQNNHDYRGWSQVTSLFGHDIILVVF